jgi:acetyl esterase/lipase
MDISEIIHKPVVYSLPGMDRAQVHPNIIYKSIEGQDLCLDAYYPSTFKFDKPLPAVLFIHGDGPAELIQDVKNWGQYISWGRLAAATGLIGIPFNHRSSSGEWAGMETIAEDVRDMAAYVRLHAAELNVDPDRLCVCAFSAGVPYLCALLSDSHTFIRCMVAAYGRLELQQSTGMIEPEVTPQERQILLRMFKKYSLLDYLQRHPSKLPPLFIIQAALDDPLANAGIDRFYAQACTSGARVELARHPAGHHGLDILDDDETTRAIIAQILGFMQTNLLN